MSRPKYFCTGTADFMYEHLKVDNCPLLSWYRMDEGPIANRLGHLVVFLCKLGLDKPKDLFGTPGKYQVNGRGS